MNAISHPSEVSMALIVGTLVATVRVIGVNM